MRKLIHYSSWLAVLWLAGLTAPAASLTVQTDQPGASLNPAMWGIFFEDINFGADTQCSHFRHYFVSKI